MGALIGLTDVGHAAELAAFAATGLALVTIVPQLRRLVRHGDTAGVSLSAAALGVVNEVFWVGYFVARSLWSAMPESMISALAGLLLIVVLVRRGVVLRTGVFAGAGWAVALAAVGVVGGHRVLGAVLVASFAVQLVPAVWTVYRTVPTGVASATWVLFGIESCLWAFYGGTHRDPPTTSIGVIGALASGTILLRTLRLRGRTRALGGGVGPRRLGAGSVFEPAVLPVSPPRRLPEPWVDEWAESWLASLESLSGRQRSLRPSPEYRQHEPT